jgi:cell division protein FtsL
MIRPSVLLLLLLVSGVASAVFLVSHQVGALDNELRDLNAKIEADSRAVHVLKAEWSYLNQPQRLEELAARHLDLHPLTGGQLIQSRPAESELVAVRIIEEDSSQLAPAASPDQQTAGRLILPGRRPQIATQTASRSATTPRASTIAHAQGRSDNSNLQVQAASVGELNQNRPIDAIEDLVDQVIAIATARGRSRAGPEHAR